MEKTLQGDFDEILAGISKKAKFVGTAEDFKKYLEDKDEADDFRISEEEANQ